MTGVSGRAVGPYERSLATEAGRFTITDLAGFTAEGHDVARLPVSLTILLENMLRHGDVAAAEALCDRRGELAEVALRPQRILMHDTTGSPSLVDLAAMRTVLAEWGFDPGLVDPVRPVAITVCHSNAVDSFACADAFAANLRAEFARNGERYAFFRWAQRAFRNLSVVPPGNGICHQVNLEHLAEVVRTETIDGHAWAFPETLVCTDSHTPMINALGIVGWGVGGLEGEAAALGHPVRIATPRVVGVRLTGCPPVGTTATDLALKMTEILRARGVVGAFVEFWGEGIGHLGVPDRATVANMAPEFGSTLAFFPIDERTLDFLRVTGRGEDRIRLVEAYAKEQGLWHAPDRSAKDFDDTLAFDLGTLEPAISGPARPEAWNALSRATKAARRLVRTDGRVGGHIPGTDHRLSDGDIVIAAITSCTNAGNPYLLAGAGLFATAAAARGLTAKPWVKTSLTPASPALVRFLAESGLQPGLDALGFHVTGIGCATCIGNSGALPDAVRRAAAEGDVAAVAVLSGNRNFDGRINPDVRAAFLVSPALVVAYAILGSVLRDPLREPLGRDADGNAVYLADLWPDDAAVQALVARHLSAANYRDAREHLYDGPDAWRAVPYGGGATFAWDPDSNYLRFPAYLDGLDLAEPRTPQIAGARALVIAGDNVTTDHISPAGAIPPDGPAGRYLRSRGVEAADFNVFAAHRGDCEVMVRGVFTHPGLENVLVPGAPGGTTRHFPSGDILGMAEAAQRYRLDGVPLIVVAGKNYGCGSSRDWGAKGPAMLGVRAVLAESFERIHRENLVCMGILPVQIPAGFRDFLDGSEVFGIPVTEDGLRPRGGVEVTIERADGSVRWVAARCRAETTDEIASIRHGGILPRMLRAMVRHGRE